MQVCLGASSDNLLILLMVSACQQRPKFKLPRAHDVVTGNLGRVWACLCTAWKDLHRISANVGLVTNTTNCDAASALAASHLHSNGHNGSVKQVVCGVKLSIWTSSPVVPQQSDLSILRGVL